jgi:hypothetical protein
VAKDVYDRVLIGPSNPCPHCGEIMNAYRHRPDWKPWPGKYLYTTQWDVCPDPSCRHVQHYPQFYLSAETPASETELPW